VRPIRAARSSTASAIPRSQIPAACAARVSAPALLGCAAQNGATAARRKRTAERAAKMVLGNAIPARRFHRPMAAADQAALDHTPVLEPGLESAARNGAGGRFPPAVQVVS